MDIEKFSIFVTACLASMRERASKQEGVLERKLKMTKDEQTLKQKLLQYEKTGLDFYTNKDFKSVFDQEYDVQVDAIEDQETIKEVVYEENAY